MRRSAGFTLLELLVAVAVLGMLLVLLEQGVGFALNASVLQVRRQERTADLPAADAAIRRLLAAADPGTYPEPAPFLGTATTLTVLTEIPGPDGLPQPADATLFAASDQLRLRWTLHHHVERFGNLPQSLEMALLDGVRSVRFDYFAAVSGTWDTVWRGDALPRLIRLQLNFVKPDRHWPPIIVALRREPLER